jgi:hypothetical protein
MNKYCQKCNDVLNTKNFYTIVCKDCASKLKEVAGIYRHKTEEEMLK